MKFVKIVVVALVLVLAAIGVRSLLKKDPQLHVTAEDIQVLEDIGISINSGQASASGLSGVLNNVEGVPDITSMSMTGAGGSSAPPSSFGGVSTTAAPAYGSEAPAFGTAPAFSSAPAHTASAQSEAPAFAAVPTKTEAPAFGEAPPFVSATPAAPVASAFNPTTTKESVFLDFPSQKTAPAKTSAPQKSNDTPKSDDKPDKSEPQSPKPTVPPPDPFAKTPKPINSVDSGVPELPDPPSWDGPAAEFAQSSSQVRTEPREDFGVSDVVAPDVNSSVLKRLPPIEDEESLNVQLPPPPEKFINPTRVEPQAEGGPTYAPIYNPIAFEAPPNPSAPLLPQQNIRQNAQPNNSPNTPQDFRQDFQPNIQQNIQQNARNGLPPRQDQEKPPAFYWQEESAPVVSDEYQRTSIRQQDLAFIPSERTLAGEEPIIAFAPPVRSHLQQPDPLYVDAPNLVMAEELRARQQAPVPPTPPAPPAPPTASAWQPIRSTPPEPDHVLPQAKPQAPQQAQIQISPQPQPPMPEPAQVSEPVPVAGVRSSVHQAVVAQRAILQEGDPAKTRNVFIQLSRLYDRQEINDAERVYMQPLLEALSKEIIFSENSHLLEAPYTVQPNDTIARISQIYSLPPELLMKLNGLTGSRPLQPGTQLKVVMGHFDAKISVKRREMTLILGGLYAGRFPVAIGENVETLRGEFYVTSKTDAYNQRTLTLNNGVTFRGVDRPQPGDSLATTIRFTVRDAEEVFGILGEHSVVVLED